MASTWSCFCLSSASFLLQTSPLQTGLATESSPGPTPPHPRPQQGPLTCPGGALSAGTPWADLVFTQSLLWPFHTRLQHPQALKHRPLLYFSPVSHTGLERKLQKMKGFVSSLVLFPMPWAAPGTSGHLTNTCGGNGPANDRTRERLKEYKRTPHTVL